MNNLLKSIFIVVLGFVSLVCISCGKNVIESNEKITLAKTILGEVEFENNDKVKIDRNEDEWIVSGEIEAMSAAQKSAFGVDGVTHTVVLKFLFDDERTIDYFKIQGETTKVYSTNKNDENYVGSISGLLDNESGEDAFCYLILSANTKEYNLTARYTDGVEFVSKITIDATLVSAKDE